MNTFDKIIFDVDSTLVTIEGLDELANLKGKRQEVTELTRLSMDGKVRLEEVFALKMAMIRPSKKDLEFLGQLYLQNITDDIVEIISLLRKLKKEVLQVTGNFYPAVKILAKHLKIPLKNVYSNKIYFNKYGEYVGFDARGPLSISGGKKVIINKIINNKPQNKIVFIGDGSTDMETKPPVKLFIGYGGIIKRPNVLSHSDIYISSRSLSPILRFILNKDEQEIGRTLCNKLFRKADKLIESNYVVIKNKSYE
ncbi:MAG: Phosphoserine phosphatase [Candidatus Roizmanbacteria bacterium GW2011_GWA2_36_23]|uniref:phosphoserine phosphatase n=1 Tax=Candidatus Roizmanbacteria bacterium GW2011_GWA2_36_23 TaxID=1618480 RepID=A0A0G0HD57_9BACT|nr:MAG: Phosphoserine phosphatase [Candidatus Roizmanbacteria bacterium GW2011_GWA2_36_23]